MAVTGQALRSARLYHCAAMTPPTRGENARAKIQPIVSYEYPRVKIHIIKAVEILQIKKYFGVDRIFKALSSTPVTNLLRKLRIGRSLNQHPPFDMQTGSMFGIRQCCK